MPQNLRFTVGWICALSVEATAAKAMLDETYSDIPQPVYDNNSYSFGRIGKHNVVIANLPAGSTGVTSAAVVAEKLGRSFPLIRIGLMVGIGGGVPSPKNDIRLGDVIVSQPTGTFGGVIQYDFGKSIQDGEFQRTGQLNRPPDVLLGAIAGLQAEHGLRDHRLQAYMEGAFKQYSKLKLSSEYPGAQHDQLFQAQYKHVDVDADCSTCAIDQLVPPRKVRQSNMPAIHYGLIASGNQLMRDGQLRDKLANELGVICFEMEAAGLMNNFPCLVIRGVCDYACSHKSKSWQAYAALVAAAYGKELLYGIAADAVDRTAQLSRDAARSTSDTIAGTLPGRDSRSPRLFTTVPLARDDKFVQRQGLFNKLDTIYGSSSNHRRAALYGLGGVGKTQLAIEYPYNGLSENQKPDSSIFWIFASNATKVLQSFRDIASKLELSGCDDPTANTPELVRRWLDDEKNGKWFVILDNADDVDVMNEVYPPSGRPNGNQRLDQRRLIDYLPQSSHGKILVTSRDRSVAYDIVGDHDRLVPVDCMDEAESLDLLGTRIAIQSDWDSAKELVKALEFIPLAITQAGSYIRQQGSTLTTKQYLAEFHASESSKASLLNEDMSDLRRDGGVPNSIITTWQMSFEQILKRRPPAADLLSLLSMYHPQSISEDIIGCEDKVDFRRNYIILQNFSLVGITKIWNDIHFNLHRLVRLATQEWLRSRKLYERWTAIAISNVASKMSARELCRRPLSKLSKELLELVPHAVELIRMEAVSRVSELEQAKLVELLLWHSGYAVNFIMSNTYAKKLFSIYSKYLDEDDRITLYANCNLALSYATFAEPAVAFTLWNEVAMTKKRKLGASHPETLTAMGQVADMSTRLGHLDTALSTQLEVLDKRLEQHADDDPFVLYDMSLLAFIYAEMGQFDKAEALFKQAIDKGNHQYKPDDLIVLTFRSGLARVYYHQGQLKEAEEIQNEVVNMLKQKLPHDHPEITGVLSDLCITLMKQERWADAERLGIQVLDIYKRKLGYMHPDTIGTMANLAMVVMGGGGRQFEAMNLAAVALKASEDAFGATHPWTIAFRECLLEEEEQFGIPPGGYVYPEELNDPR